MLTIEKNSPLTCSYPLDRLGEPDSLLFFDIETTGFSGDTETVYLIGCISARNEQFLFRQWFADTREAEKQVLQAFFEYSKDFRTLVHFNGDTFDLPFLKKRAAKHTLSCPLNCLESVDLYRRIRPWKKHLGLTGMKQKAIEDFWGIAREDLCSGGQLIAVYKEYIKTRSTHLLKLLLLHNEDDLKGMPALLPILYYPDFLTQEFRMTDIKKSSGQTDNLVITLKGDPATVLPIPLKASLPPYAIRAERDLLTLSVRPYEGTLRYYYPNYKDYYYLIYEDMAVHKSVGEYVDKDARTKATRETCYTKRTGVFLPQPSPVFSPAFQNAPADRRCFFEFTPDCLSDAAKLNLYVQAVIKAIFAGR
ncbi:MAG: ribonuclease H-like domain-containing protein [Lachnospiraceae bacterium]|nr:ribonuclease H-like domain-containing protein [Lachnospiraceae bacterium]